MTLAERLDGVFADQVQINDILPGDDRSLFSDDGLVPAAVLIAITDRSEPGMILTHRTSTMRKHAGQISFPGGRVDAEDVDVIAAALREAKEEIALPPEHVRIIGTTDPYRTGTGYRITPVIGVIPPDIKLSINRDEVDSWFEAPLSFVLNPANHAVRDIMWQGQNRNYYEIQYENHRIWGATAAMIVNLGKRLSWA